MRICILLLLNFCIGLCNAQFCTGSLGENIFTEGDFGNGVANLVSTNPNVAPGYNYTLNVPPFDGSYVIANNTFSWDGLFATWLAIGDNSPDPNGYMMVVNATNSPGLFYEQTITGLCENTLYEFSADIINLIRTGTPNHIDPNVSFLINGEVLFSTDDIPKTNNWISYGFTFTSEENQESLTLSLRNNAPGGNGNDLAIDNISFRACGPEISILPEEEVIFLCEDDEPPVIEAQLFGTQYTNPVFQWQQSSDGGLTWSNISGANEEVFVPAILGQLEYRFRVLIADGINNLNTDKCRVNSETKIINVLQKETNQMLAICEGLTTVVGDSEYSESGTFRDTFINFLGCDSIVVTELEVVSESDIEADIIVSPTCTGTMEGRIEVVNIRGTRPPFQFSLSDGDFENTNIFTNLEGGLEYTIVIQDAVGCTLELLGFVDSSDDSTLELGESLVVELGETVTINPIVNFSPSLYNWQSLTPNECLLSDDCTDLVFTPFLNQEVRLELINEDGCAVVDSVFIEVIDVRKAWLPNAFSPNGDGINDRFVAYGDSPNVEAIQDFRVYDRWGSLLFEAKNFQPNDYESGWDGIFRGENMPTGVYFYTANIRFIDQQIILYSGNISLVR